MNTSEQKKMDFGANVHLRDGVRPVDDQVVQSLSGTGRYGQRDGDISLNKKCLPCTVKLPVEISCSYHQVFQLKHFHTKSKHTDCSRTSSDKIQMSAFYSEGDRIHSSLQGSVKHGSLECHMGGMLPFMSLLHCDQPLQNTSEKDGLWRHIDDIFVWQLTAVKTKMWRSHTQQKVLSCHFFSIIYMLASRTARLALLPLCLFWQLAMSSALCHHLLFTAGHLLMPDIRSCHPCSWQQTIYMCGSIVLEIFKIKINQFCSNCAKGRKIKDNLFCGDNDRIMLMNCEKNLWVRKNTNFSCRDNLLASEKLATVRRLDKKEKAMMDVKEHRSQHWSVENGEPSGADSVYSCPDISRFLRPWPLVAMIYPVQHQANSHQAAKPALPHRLDRSQQPRAETNMTEDYKQEIRRLASFSTLPATTKFFVTRLASAGFYCSEDGIIRCFFCKLEKCDWKQWEKPMQVHQQLRPQCPIVSGINCENVPIACPAMDAEQRLRQFWSLTDGRGPSSSGAQIPASLLPVGDVKSASTGGTHIAGSVPTVKQGVSASSSGSTSQPAQLGVACCTLLADQGFRQSGTVTKQPDGERTGEGEMIVAPLASALQSSQSHAVASEQPASATGPLQLVPDLNFNSDTGLSRVQPSHASAPSAESTSLASSSLVNDGTSHPENRSPEAASQTGEGQQVVTYQQLGILTESPKHPNMAVYQARMNSFSNWPSQNNQTPADLVQAGFFYAGYGDCGRCFFCGGGLKNWEAGDNPWIEHARWFPRCAYIRLSQGQDFIDVVQFLNNRQQHITMDEVKTEINSRRADGERLQEPAMDPAVRSVLGLGYAGVLVETAVQQLRQQGVAVTAAQLLDLLHREGHSAVVGDDAGDVDVETEYIEEMGRENCDMRQQHICKICLDRDVCIVFLPCGHLVCCAECSPALTTCPVCRQRIKGRVRAFSA